MTAWRPRTRSPRFSRERAASELPLIRKIESESPRTAIIPLQSEEPVGVEKLLSLTI